jgi:hypothetical protein
MTNESKKRGEEQEDEGKSVSLQTKMDWQTS